MHSMYRTLISITHEIFIGVGAVGGMKSGAEQESFAFFSPFLCLCMLCLFIQRNLAVFDTGLNSIFFYVWC